MTDASSVSREPVESGPASRASVVASDADKSGTSGEPGTDALVCTCGGAEKGHINFDRSICACGAMHYFCDDCGFQAEPCDDERSVSSEPKTEGWYGPPNSRRFHYFREGRSLCGKWLVLAPNSEIPWDCALGPANGDCAGCKAQLAKESA